MGSPETAKTIILLALVMSLLNIHAWSSQIKVATPIALPLNRPKKRSRLQFSAIPNQDLEGSIPLKNHRETMECMGQENNSKGWLWRYPIGQLQDPLVLCWDIFQKQ